MEFVFDVLLWVLDLAIGPSGWRKMSGPAVTFSAILFGLFGLIIVAAGVGLTLGNQALWWRIFGVAASCAGIWLLVDVGRGIAAFFRVRNGPA
jgi:uncharacterized protein YjeT (DUF2065 family)